MNCDDFQLRLQNALDQRDSIAEDQTLLLHANQCPDCHAMMQTWSQIEAGLQRPATSNPEPEVISSSHRRSLSVIAATAACLLIGFFVAQRFPTAGDPHFVADTGPRENLKINGNAATTTRPPVTTPRTLAPSGVQQGSHAASDEMVAAAMWQSMQGQDLVGRTLPTVQSINEAMAPLRRSLIQAVAVLTMVDARGAS